MSRRWGWGMAGMCGLLVIAGGYADHVWATANASMNVSMVDPRTVALHPSPIRRDWVLEGHPEATAAEIAHTNDGSTQVFVWRTSAGRFNLFYDFDEVVSVLDGEMFLIDGANAGPGRTERRIGPGDVVFFPAGSTATWRVPDHVRKIATLRHPLPGPIASVARWAKAIKGWLTPTTALAADDRATSAFAGLPQSRT